MPLSLWRGREGGWKGAPLTAGDFEGSKDSGAAAAASLTAGFACGGARLSAMGSGPGMPPNGARRPRGPEKQPERADGRRRRVDCEFES